jgi:phosphoglycolate phosphatase-like HAD superfamily hydrolase
MRCYIFDIDGTIADLSHRLPHIQKDPKDWDGFFAACKDDAPIQHTIKLAIDVALAGANIVYVSGRSDQCREATETWLREHALPEGRVYMRKAGDHRPDFKVKVELLEQLRAEGHSPVMAFDDRNSVVKMWRELGIPCAQVADGDF